MSGSEGRLARQTVVITAAAQGIGRAAALACAQAGARVIATDIAMEKLATLQAEFESLPGAVPEPRLGSGELICTELDVTSEAAINALATEYPAPDALFNCAGYVHHGSVLQSSAEDWSLALDLNVLSMVRTLRAFLPGMIAAQRGSIINMSSVASSLKGVPLRCVYSTTKAAVIGLTKSVAADYIGSGIRCNAICPGTVETPSLAERIAALDDPQVARAAFVARQPMGRLGSPQEIAALVVYLASDESSYTSGTTHVIDGGWLT